MPVCRLCKKRIELAYRGVRAYRCSSCFSTVCRDHFEPGKKLCFECAGLPYTVARKTFIRTGVGNENQG